MPTIQGPTFECPEAQAAWRKHIVEIEAYDRETDPEKREKHKQRSNDHQREAIAFENQFRQGLR